MFYVTRDMLMGVTVLLVADSGFARAATLRVPADHRMIQAAVDAASPGDVVLVAPGTYAERVRLRAGVTLRSDGDDAPGKLGLRRAEETIIDGGGAQGAGPGVEMAESSTLDGFTVTNVGVYDDAQWNKHHATQGSEQPYEMIGAPGTAGIGVDGVTCTIRSNIVHHIGYTGIALQGAPDRRSAPYVVNNVCYRNMGGGIGAMQGSAAVIEANVCFQNFFAGIGHENANPLVVRNVCYENIRAGIGISEGACPTVRGNKCYRNRRAGIGIRTGANTAPLVEDNDCYANDMAGIGCDEGAAPLIRSNRCYENALAGIGCRDESRPLIVGNKCYRNKMSGIGSEGGAQSVISRNECYENLTAGIGQRGDARTLLIANDVHHNKTAGIGFDECRDGQADVIDNRVVDNEKVAVGIHAGWKVRLSGNELARGEGLPPVVMVFRGAEADFSDNTFRGVGVAAIRTEGVVRVTANRFESPALRRVGPPQFAVWGLPGSDVVFNENEVRGWRHAVSAEQAALTASGNRLADYGNVGFKLDQPVGTAVVVGNEFKSDRDRVGVAVTGGEAIVSDNRFPGSRE